MTEINESSADRSDSSEETSGPPVIAAEIVDQLPVTLEVRIGSVTLSASELGEMEQGAILMLGESDAKQVEIIAGEKTIAQGEIVAVNDRLAVRIVRIINSGPSAEE